MRSLDAEGQKGTHHFTIPPPKISFTFHLQLVAWKLLGCIFCLAAFSLPSLFGTLPRLSKTFPHLLAENKSQTESSKNK